MPKTPSAAALLGALVLVSGCVTPARQDTRQSGPVCTYDGLVLTADFPGGRLNGCLRTGPGRYRLRFSPEKPDINPSPWYAFRIESKRARRLTLNFDYDGYKHRYPPKLNRGKGWQPFNGPVILSDGDRRAGFRLKIRRGRTGVAAQPLVMPADTDRWIEKVGASSELEPGVLGTSAEGRLMRFLRSPDHALPTVLIVGRQHPPEVSGAFALEAFVSRLLKNDPPAKRFRARFGLLVVPMLNPDGTVHGNWRLDSAGTDLNRDWGPFARPETRLVRDALERVVRDEGGLVLALDFHSTHRDVLYTQPDHAKGALGWLPGAWHVAINGRLTGPPMDRNSAHNPGKPTFKSWVYDTYAVPGITFELADEASRARIDELSTVAAEEMMRLLLERESRPAESASGNLSHRLRRAGAAGRP